uniref:Putative ovule protein n=1 Tax=Solanum chacoense TaxID=4108 RepID=A0A0V0IC72_SOLCH
MELLILSKLFDNSLLYKEVAFGINSIYVSWRSYEIYFTWCIQGRLYAYLNKALALGPQFLGGLNFLPIINYVLNFYRKD